MGIKEEKAAVRAKISAFRIPPEERIMASVAVCSRLRARVEWSSAGTVLLYAPLADELNVLLLMASGKQIGRAHV